MGNLSNEDDLCWFTPANAVEDSEVVLKSGSKLSTLSGHPEASKENGADPTNDCNQKSSTAGDRRNFKSMDTDDSALNHLSFGNVLDTQSESKDDTMFSDQVSKVFIIYLQLIQLFVKIITIVRLECLEFFGLVLWNPETLVQLLPALEDKGGPNIRPDLIRPERFRVRIRLDC